MTNLGKDASKKFISKR